MARSDNKYIIGLTGNIAVGKSVVRRMLQHLGAYTIDADGLTHQAMMPGAPAYKPVVEMFGRFVLDPNGQINRGRLGAIAFAVPEAMAALESAIHPVVGGAIQTLVSRATQRVIVVEAIKLLEGNLASMCDSIWVVDAPPEIQLKRLIETRSMTEAEARKRIAAQNAQADKLARAHVVIKNDTDVDSTWRQVQSAFLQLSRPAPAPAPVPAPAALQRQPAAAAPVAAPPVRPIAQPSAPAPTAAPATAPVKNTDTQEAVVVGGIKVRRGTPNHAEAIAQFITQYGGKSVSRMDIMLGFGEKSYLMAQDDSGAVMAVVGWQVENLIASVDEVYISPNAPREATIAGLVESIEKSARELQSEVSFIFLPVTSDPSVRQAFVNNGYSALKIEELGSPAWRESAHEQLHDSVTGLYKQLRTDRVVRPI